MDKKQVPLAPVHDRLTSYMEEKSMRKTPERYEILRVAELANGIFTIDGLMQLMKEHGKFQVSRATIFNTMELFCDAGLVIKHPITKVSTSTAKLALQSLHVRYFAIEDKLLYMHGLCRKCQAKNRQEARKNKLKK